MSVLVLRLTLWLWLLCGWSAGKAAVIIKEQRKASELFKQVRVLCMVMTDQSRHDSVAVHMKRTWAQRCNRVLFISDQEHNELETRVLRSDDKWDSVRRSFRFVYDYYRTEADWFLKVEDDGFVIMENLRYLLSAYSPAEPLYFGSKFKTPQIESFMFGESGYVLSKEALRRFVYLALPNATICQAQKGAYEDVEMGRCLSAVRVTAGDSRDTQGRHTFVPLKLQEYFGGVPEEASKWLQKYSYYSLDNETLKISPYVISFPNVNFYDVYDLTYLIYRLRIFGKN